jgi:tryptophan 2,3-dioxygenase
MACPYLNPDKEGETIIGSKSTQVSYGGYLKVPQLLSLQELESAKHGEPAHDELLFITIHQVYELWFKQILFEIDSVATMFASEHLQERLMLKIVSRLTRVVEILKLLVGQIELLDTMTPLDFMEFRDVLAPASGFQSVQFRLLENKLGIKPASRVKYHKAEYTSALTPDEAKIVNEVSEQRSLLEFVQLWLERTPGLETTGFDFWAKYADATAAHLADQRAKAVLLPENERALAAQEIQFAEEVYASILSKEKHDALVASADRSLSHEAIKGAMMIFLYRDEPLFHLPFSMLTLLQEIDSQLMKWRHNHVTMVQRMIGNKMGIGGSSGYQYLRSTISDRYKVFLDLCNLSTFIVPRKFIPQLDEDTRHSFGYCLGM